MGALGISEISRNKWTKNLRNTVFTQIDAAPEQTPLYGAAFI